MSPRSILVPRTTWRKKKNQVRDRKLMSKLSPLTFANGTNFARQSAAGKAKGKRAGARNLVQRLKKLDQNQHEDRGGSYSIFQHGRPPKNYPGKLTNMVYDVNGNGLLTNGTGKVLVADCQALFTVGDCNSMVTQALNNQFQTATPLGYRTDRILMKEATGVMQFTNGTNTTQFITLYDVVNRRDIFPYNTVTGSPATVNLTPSQAWAQGDSNEITGATQSGNQYVGSTPFESQLFCKMYTVKKITHVVLAAGQTHKHTTVWKPNYVLDSQLLNQTSIVSLGKLSSYVLATVQGAPVRDNASGVTTAQTEVLYVQTISYEFTYLPNNVKTLIQNSTTLSGTANATAALIDAIDGLKEIVETV